MFKAIKSKNCDRKIGIVYFNSNRMQSFFNWRITLWLTVLLLIHIVKASPILHEEIVIDYHNSNNNNNNNINNNNNNNGSLDKSTLNLSEKLSNTKYNDEDLQEDREEISETKPEGTDQFIEDLSNDDKTFYIVKASPINKRPNKQAKVNSSRQKKIFKADKNLQRLEKKSWKIPIKSLALFSENTKDPQAPQKMMDELTDLFDSFKDA
jgi:hypothetical protein